MSVIVNIRKALDGIDRFASSSLIAYGEWRNIRKKSGLINSVVLTKAQEQEIDSFYKEYYAKSVDKSWHRLYQSYTGVFRHDYFPEILFSTRLEPLLNPRTEAEVLGDKNLLPLLFGSTHNVHIPWTFL